MRFAPTSATSSVNSLLSMEGAQAFINACMAVAAFGPVKGAKMYHNQVMQTRAGQMGGGLLGRVLTIVVVPMVVIIGLIVFSQFETSVNYGDLSADGQTSFNTTTTNSYSGFDLAAVLPIVVAGVAVLGVVISAFVFDLGR